MKSSQLGIIWGFLIVILGLSSCGCASDANNSEISATDTVYAPLYASGFQILQVNESSKGESADSAIILRSLNPWQGARDTERTLMITSGDFMPDGFSGQILKGMPKRIVCMSSTQVAMLEELGVADRIVGVSGLQFISSDYIRKNKEKIVDVGYEGNIDYEKLVGASPDLVLLYGISGVNPMETKLKSLGIPFAYIGEYLEDSPLGKAEWMVAIGAITGKEKEAKSKFAAITERYFALKDSVGKIGAPKPKVMLNMPYRDQWYVPSKGSYLVRLIEDAGGEYVVDKRYFPDLNISDNSNESVVIDLEHAVRMCDAADVWLNQGSGIEDKEGVRRQLPKLKDSAIFSKGKLFNNTLRQTPGGGNDFYEKGVLQPDVILSDLISIFYPESFTSPLRYYKELK